MFDDDVRRLRFGKNSSVDLDKLIGGIKKSDIDNQKLLSVFGKVDTDGNGIIDQGELSNFLNGVLKAAQDNNLSAGEAQTYYNSLGLDGKDSGTIVSFLKHLETFGENIQETQNVVLNDGSAGISIKYKPDEKGNITTMLYRKDNGNLAVYTVSTPKGVRTSLYYDKSGLSTVKSIVEVKGLVLTSDNMGRLVKKEEESQTSEYKYEDDTVIPKKIIAKFKDGKLIIFQDGKKIVKLTNGTTTEETDNRTRIDTDDIRNILNKLKPSGSQGSAAGAAKIPSAKEVASRLTKMLSSPIPANNAAGHIRELQNYIAQNITKDNVDWVLYEYKVLTKRDLFSDIETKLKKKPLAAAVIKRKLADTQYEKYGVNLNYKNQNSVVKNKYHNGDVYSVVQTGTIIRITNKNTKQTRRIDLDKLLKNYPNARDRALMIKKLQTLPGEVLMDIAVETDSFIPMKSGEVVTVANGAQCNAAGYYNGGSDTVHLDPKNGVLTMVHEMGHALDYNGQVQNASSVLRDPNFKRIFNEEMRSYISAGNQRFSFNSPNQNRSTYATANEKEMFAECYTLLMMGECGSQAVIEKYFPRTLGYINNKINRIRAMNDSIRHD